MSKFFKHLHLVNKHRWTVFKLCTKCGLLWRGLTHDLSKYSPTELIESVKYFTGKCSPITMCRKTTGYSNAWLHHKGRNKHHVEYWYDRENKVQAVIPYQFAVESICDKIAATKCYMGKRYKNKMVYDYWIKADYDVPMNERIREFFDKVLIDLMENGEKYILNKKYMKKTYAEIVGEDDKKGKTKR